MRKSIIISVVAVAMLSIPVFAAHHGGHHDNDMQPAGPTTRVDVENRVKTDFAAVDTNKDGFIVAAEAEAARAKRRAEKRDQHFAGMDSNNDGSISRAEFDAEHQEDSAVTEGKRGGNWRGGGRHGADGHGAGHHGGGDKMGGLTNGWMFKRADANADGKVSLVEAMTRPLARFDSADVDKDGTLTVEERKTAREAMRGKWREKRG
jgi:Ca2+-binding EF-hand superfamily protein